jgi:hypothetical protein
LWADLQPLMDDKLPLILHFRWATHGEVNVENCHPFELKDGALIHNGVISGMGTSSYSKYYTPPKGKACEAECDDRSDTREFVEDYLADMGVSELLSAKKLIEHTIGYSKLVTIHHDGSVHIFNERSGHWRNGVWYSNDSYKPAKALSANPMNLVPKTAPDYHGTTKYTPSVAIPTDEDDTGDAPDGRCSECGSDKHGQVYYDPIEDVFLVECHDCSHEWTVYGEWMSIAEYNALYRESQPIY